MPLLFSEGVRTGRLSLQQFVALTSTNHARMYGLHPKKGTLSVGADADIAVWDPEKAVTLRAADLHDAVGYTPYEGLEITGWPTTVISRGEVIIDDGALHAERGRGRFIARGLPAPLQKTREISPRAALLRKIFPAVIEP
ncbi:D-hydantoinase [compost metagenome]